METRINNLLNTKKNILSIYFTAGFPALMDTVSIIDKLSSCGVDMIEIGVPFSDPIADGPVIQQSNTKAIENGMTLQILFEQLKGIREKVQIPLILMSSINPIMQFGFEEFCHHCKQIDIDGLIIPDLPLEEYCMNYKNNAARYNLHNIFLITPSTSEDRTRLIDDQSNSFIYMVSSQSTTGKTVNFENDFLQFSNRVKAINLKHPCITGFGIHDRKSFEIVCQNSNGGIIGSAFVRAVGAGVDLESSIEKFMKQFDEKLSN